MSRLRWFVVAVVAAVALVVGGTWLYINVIREDAPPPLALDDAGPTSTAPASTAPADTTPARSDGIDGTWVATAQSVAGYRVDEILFGQSTEAVGRTDQVDGQLTIERATVTAASFEIDMASVSSDESRRDAQFRGQVMDVATHPTATFVLTTPIELGPDAPLDGATVDVEATGDLTLRGTTRSVTIPLEGRLAGARIEVVGSLRVVFDDWGIPNPSRPGIETDDEGVLEVLLVFDRG